MIDPDYNLLPPPLRSDERSRAFLATLWLQLITRDNSILLIYYLDRVSTSVLPALAAHLDVLGYKGWLLARDDQERRELLKIAFDLHRYAGTRYAIRRALAWLGYDQTFVIEENPGTFHDGLSIPARDGTVLREGARVGEFSVRTSGNRSFNLDELVLIVRLIEAWKPASRRLFDLYINDVPVFRQLRLHNGVHLRDGSIDRTGYELLDLRRAD